MQIDLVTKRPQIGQAVAAVGEHDGQVVQDPPGIMGRGRSRVGAIAALSPSVRPSRSANSTRNTLPACDTNPVASATTCTLLLHVRRVTFTTILLSGGNEDSTPPFSVLSRTFRRSPPPATAVLSNDPG